MQYQNLIENTNDSSYTNIEFGAGCGNFGQIYFSKCYITDKEDGSLCPTKYIDFVCDIKQPLPWVERFATVIMCNPNGYGFKDDEEGLNLLVALQSILTKDGYILVLGNDSNTSCKQSKIKNRVEEYNNKSSNSKIEATYENIDAATTDPDYSFFQVGSVRQTPVTQKTILRYVAK